MERRHRSIVKTLSWRVTATIDTFLLSWLVTGSLTFAGSIASLEVMTKMFLYYFHERLWSKITWGRQPIPVEMARPADDHKLASTPPST